GCHDAKRASGGLNLEALQTPQAMAPAARWNAVKLVAPRAGRSELAKRHGQLLAFCLGRQNTGHGPICYRLTLSGQRALRRSEDAEEHEELEAVALAAE